MVEYRAALFTYRPIENVPENVDELTALGYNLDQLSGGEVIVFNIQRNLPTGELLPSMEEFEARYEIVQP